MVETTPIDAAELIAETSTGGSGCTIMLSVPPSCGCSAMAGETRQESKLVKMAAAKTRARSIAGVRIGEISRILSREFYWMRPGNRGRAQEWAGRPMGVHWDGQWLEFRGISAVTYLPPRAGGDLR